MTVIWKGQMKLHMKSRILLIAALTAVWAQKSQTELAAATLAVPGVTIQQTYRGMPWLDYSKSPWLDYSRLPWLKAPARAQTDSAPSVEALVVNLKADIDTAISGLTGLGDSLKNDQQTAMVTGEATSLATDLSTLLSQDFSTLLSQDLSVNYGQLLSTSLAVPTSAPRPNWNRQDAVVVRTPSGEMVVPTYPPRTAWGNEGTVVTTPGGAVYSMVSAASETRKVADSEALRDINNQLLAAQKEVERLQTLLNEKNNNLPSSPIQTTPLKPGNPAYDQESVRLPSDKLPSDKLPSR